MYCKDLEEYGRGFPGNTIPEFLEGIQEESVCRRTMKPRQSE